MKRFSKSRKMPDHGRIPNVDQGAWICYQLRLKGMTQVSLAADLGVSQQTVQRIAYGMGTSARVQKAIAKALGFKAWSELAAARQGVAA